MTQRITDLEIKVAFLEGSLQDYDQLFQELFKKVEFLQREIKRLEEEGKQSVEPFSLEQEKPPHY